MTGTPIGLERALANAAEAGDMQALKAALAQGADPSAEVPDGEKRFSTDEWPTSLQYAIKGRHDGVVQALLDAHSSCDAPKLSRLDWLMGSNRAIVRESPGLCHPPFHHAVQYGRVAEAQAIWKALVEAGASHSQLRILMGSGPNSYTVNNDWEKKGMGTWLLQEAIKLAHWPIDSLQISREMVAFLFDAREECHFSDARFLGLHPDKLLLRAYQLSNLTERVSVLHAIASTHGDVEFATFLLQRAGAKEAKSLLWGITPSACDPTNNTESALGPTPRHVDRYLFDPFVEDDQWTVLIAAAWYGRPAMVDFILDQIRSAAPDNTADAEVLKYLKLGKRQGSDTPAALMLARHRASKFKVLVEHATGVRPGPAPKHYTTGTKKNPVQKKMPEQPDFRHYYLDRRSAEEMLRDLEECVVKLEAVCPAPKKCTLQ